MFVGGSGVVAKGLLLIGCLLLSGGPTFAGNEPAKASKDVMPPIMQNRAKPVEITGEVVDTWCWSSGVMREGRGAKHKSCALACVAGGVTAGIVDDKGNLYIAAKSKAYNGCRDQLLPFVSKRVKIKGFIASRGGCSVLKISEVKEVK